MNGLITCTSQIDKLLTCLNTKPLSYNPILYMHYEAFDAANYRYICNMYP